MKEKLTALDYGGLWGRADPCRLARQVKQFGARQRGTPFCPRPPPACPAGEGVPWLPQRRTSSPAGQAGGGRRDGAPGFHSSRRTPSPAGQAGRGRKRDGGENGE